MAENVTAGQVINATIDLFTEDCLRMAKENWSSSQVEMLETLFDAERKGCEYRCVRCEHFGRAADAPETVEECCMWQQSENNGWTKPCEEDE